MSPNVADSELSTAGSRVEHVIESSKDSGMTLTSSAVEKMLKSPQSTFKVGLINESVVIVESFSSREQRSSWRARSWVSPMGESRWALTNRAFHQ